MDTMTHHIRSGEAIDLFLGELARKGRGPECIKAYRRLLNHLANDARSDLVSDWKLEDPYEVWLNRWAMGSPSTLATSVSLGRTFSRFLWKRGYSETWVCEGLERPKRRRPEDLDVVSITTDDVARCLAAAETWQELLCVGTAGFTGARRKALANARRRDLDLDTGTIKFVEKNGKVIVKPVPHQLLLIYRAADEDGVWADPDAYLIPNRRPRSVRNKVRSDKVIWNTVRLVAARVGVKAHVHAFRAAFAVAFDDAHPDKATTLMDLMGHSRIDTTMIYLRRRNKARKMEAVRDLSFGTSGFESQGHEAHTGFEPVSGAIPVPEPLSRKLDELSAKAREARSRDRRS